MCLLLEKTKLKCMIIWDPKNPNSVWKGPFGCTMYVITTTLSMIIIFAILYFLLVAFGLLGVAIVNKYDINTGCQRVNNNMTNCSYNSKSICYKDNNDALYGGCLLVGVLVFLVIFVIVFALILLAYILQSCRNSYNLADDIVNGESTNKNLENDNNINKNDDDIIPLDR